MSKRERSIYCGDNLTILDGLPTETVDLVYLDPPFASGKEYQITDRTSGKLIGDGYRDLWAWDEECELLLNQASERSSFWMGMEMIFGHSPLLAYLLFLAPRLTELKRLLKTTGSLYLHCDQRASAHLKLLLDDLFGSECYLNTIVWCYGLGGSSPRRWPRKHDDILWYSKEVSRHYFTPAMQPATSLRMRGELKKTPDYWHIPSLNNMAKERTGYPTQKPLVLLERIIASSSPPGGLVLDPFCGSGTTLEAAETLGRGWIGIDSNPKAVSTAQHRLQQLTLIEN